MSTALPLQQTSALMTEVAGRPVVAHYGDPEAEYGALRTGALLVDRSHRTRMRLIGALAPELLTGLVTNDVMSLAPGQGQYAAALTAKGKITADVRIFALAQAELPTALGATGALLVDVPPRAAAAWLEMVRKFVNPRLALYRDDTESTRDFGVFGEQARTVVAEATGASATALAGLPMYGHVMVDVDGATVMIARVPDLELEGYELFVAADAADALWRRLAAAGAVPGGLVAWETARIEAGRPEWGIDIDDTTIPQEANLDDLHAISYTKGCYIGQETVARVHFRGHVNRHLRGLRFASDELPPLMTPLVDETGKPVGDVRSTTRSPRLGAIGIGMVRREIALGGTVAARWEGGETGALVTGLPL